MSAQPLFLRGRRGAVGSLGETALIERIRSWLGAASPPSPAGIGDDCAVLARTMGRGLLTIDPVVYGVHFDGRVSAAQAGAKVMKRNLSDIAAMGGRPVSAVVALALDDRVSLRWLRAFYRGMAREALRHGFPIVGGDVTRLNGAFAATVAMTGEAAGRVLTRSGARPGDWIYVTGRLGLSLASGRHHRFTPRLKEGSWLARHPAVRAMMDVSDGLAKDLPSLTPRLCEAAVFEGMLPLSPGATPRQALCDGEDYELVMAVAGGKARLALERAWSKAFPRTRLTCIGRFVRKGDAPPGSINPEHYRGYEHLR